MDVIFEILFNPLEDMNVIIINNIIANTDIARGPVKPNIFQVEVVSLPKNTLDKGIHIEDDTDTIHIRFEENHINVTIKANLGFTDLAIQEYIPPFSFLKAAPYSAIIKA